MTHSRSLRESEGYGVKGVETQHQTNLLNWFRSSSLTPLILREHAPTYLLPALHTPPPTPEEESGRQLGVLDLRGGHPAPQTLEEKGKVLSSVRTAPGRTSPPVASTTLSGSPGLRLDRGRATGQGEPPVGGEWPRGPEEPENPPTNGPPEGHPPEDPPVSRTREESDTFPPMEPGAPTASAKPSLKTLRTSLSFTHRREPVFSVWWCRDAQYVGPGPRHCPD